MNLACPTEAELRQYLLGKLNDQKSAELELHLDQCPQCPARLRNIDVDSQLIRSFSQSSSLFAEGLPEDLERFIHKLESLGPTSKLDSTEELEKAGAFACLSPPEQPDEVGRLAGYRVLRLLGAGGMGFVFLAEDPVLDRRVGLKVLRPRANRHSDGRERFLHEARAMARLKHDHIAVIHQVGEVDQAESSEPIPFLSMELLDGMSLYQWLKQQPRSRPEWVVRIGQHAADGLAAAHAQGLIHRDIKPSNLWLEAPLGWKDLPAEQKPPLPEVGRVKLIDFGLATSLNELEVHGKVVGTPHYMAPEQLAGMPANQRSDIFSLGCVLYELSTGERPFPASRIRNPSEPIVPVPACDLNPRIPIGLSRLIGRMIAHEPQSRPASAAEVKKALQLIGQESFSIGSWIKRRRLAVAAATAVLLIGLSAWNWNVAGSGGLFSGSSSRGNLDQIPPFPDGEPDEWWLRRVAERSPQERFRLVSEKIAELNPGYDPRESSGWVEPELVIRYTIKSDIVSDVRPVRALRDLKNFRIEGSAPGQGSFSDLAQLGDLRLVSLAVVNQPSVVDLKPIIKMRLHSLDLAHTGVSSLEPIQELPLKELSIRGTAVTDLSPIRRLSRLEYFDCSDCPISDWRPLEGSAIVELYSPFPPEILAKLAPKMPKLKSLNGLEINEFWKRHRDNLR